MSDHSDYLHTLIAFSKAIGIAKQELTKYPESYFFEKIEGYINVLFNKYAPFRTGDRVALTQTPDITEEKSWGWLGSKHFLIKGAKGIVKSVDYDSGRGFCAQVVFDDESWIDKEGHRQKLSSPSQYSLSEDYLVKI